MSEQVGSRQRAAATKRARTQRSILDAASKLFNEHGYSGVTLEAVATEAGVGVATIANHFPTKRALAIAAYAQPLLALMTSTEKELTSEAKPVRLFERFIRELSVVLAASPVMTYALLPLSRDSRNHGRDDEATYVVSFQQLVDFLGTLLERCGSVIQNTASAMDVADFYLGGLLTWIIQHPERSGEDAADLVLNQLL